MATKMKVMFRYVYSTPTYDEHTYGYGIGPRMYPNEVSARDAFNIWRRESQSQGNHPDPQNRPWSIEDAWPNYVGVAPVYFMVEE